MTIHIQGFQQDIMMALELTSPMIVDYHGTQFLVHMDQIFKLPNTNQVYGTQLAYHGRQIVLI